MVTMARSVEGDETFTFFFTAREPFSQWHPSPFEHEGVRYATCEMWMMAEKARLFGDAETLARILANPDPKASKALGRAVRGFDDRRWSDAAVDVIERGNVLKYAQNARLDAALAATRGTTLVEASPYDRIYGIGLDATSPLALSRRTWRGRNLLGLALTRVRVARHGS